MWIFEAATVAKLPTVVVLVWVVIDWDTVDTLDVVVIWLLTDDFTTAAIVGPLLFTVVLALIEGFAFTGVGLIVF